MLALGCKRGIAQLRLSRRQDGRGFSNPTCFITAPAGANLEVLTEALRQRDVRVVVPESLEPGAEFGAEILNLIAGVDLVIGVLTRERRSEWVLFELGLAWGRGKRVVLFASA